MKHYSRLLSAFLAFLLFTSIQTVAQVTKHPSLDVKRTDRYIGVSPQPQVIRQGLVAFESPIPRNIKIRKGVVGKRSVMKFADRVPKEKGGYYLYVGRDLIVMAGRDADGLFYAEQTLKQLVSHNKYVLETEIKDWPSVDCRGAIEGFYGNPWSHEDRIRQFQFYGENKMNMYVYGPKDDPYHRRHWREPYPKKEAELLKELAREAKKNQVQFVWAVHPGIDIQWNLQDSMAIVNKLESVYKLGVRSFAVFFDDIGGEGTKADKQAGLMNYITKQFVRKHKDVQPLILCPTQYNMAWSHGDYLSTLGKQMYPEIRIMWTGASVVDMIQKNDMDWINEQIGRKAFIWLNYPVNDYCQSRMLMGKTYGNGKDIAEQLSGFCSNPMEYAEASKVSLFSIADYTWNMGAYKDAESWQHAIWELMPTCPEAFKMFCENNVDLGVTGHGLRREGESPVFAPYLKKLNELTESNAKRRTSPKGKEAGYQMTQQLCKEIDFETLLNEFKGLVWAANTLLGDSVHHPQMINEIAPWVKAMYHTGLMGIDVCEEALALNQQEPYKFVFLYDNYKSNVDARKKIRSRDFEGSIVKAQPAFSGDVITPLIKQLSDTLTALYKMQYRENWDIFPHGVLPDGEYYIIYNDMLLTDSLASPYQTGDFPVFKAEKDVINPQRQLWRFVYNEKTESYNIFNVQDDRYLNEMGSFWRDIDQNPFDATYHSFQVEKVDNKFSIKQTGRGGNNYWGSNGRRITAGSKDQNPVFQIVPKDQYGK